MSLTKKLINTPVPFMGGLGIKDNDPVSVAHFGVITTDQYGPDGATPSEHHYEIAQESGTFATLGVNDRIVSLTRDSAVEIVAYLNEALKKTA